jgi:hypothetical protein
VPGLTPSSRWEVQVTKTEILDDPVLDLFERKQRLEPNALLEKHLEKYLMIFSNRNPVNATHAIEHRAEYYKRRKPNKNITKRQILSKVKI